LRDKGSDGLTTWNHGTNLGLAVHVDECPTSVIIVVGPRARAPHFGTARPRREVAGGVERAKGRFGVRKKEFEAGVPTENESAELYRNGLTAYLYRPGSSPSRRYGSRGIIFGRSATFSKGYKIGAQPAIPYRGLSTTRVGTISVRWS